MHREGESLSLSYAFRNILDVGFSFIYYLSTDPKSMAHGHASFLECLCCQEVKKECGWASLRSSLSIQPDCC